jgi:hypothetical protein
MGTKDEDKHNQNNPEKLTTMGTQDEDKHNQNNPEKRQQWVHRTKTNTTKTIQRN